MPLDVNDFLQKSYEALMVFFSEWRIYNPWRKPEVNLEEFNFELIRPARSSAFNKVYRCRDRDTNQVVIIKEIVISGGNKELQRSVIRKLHYLHKEHHDNIVRMLGILTRGNCVYVVYESFTYDLCYFIRQPKNSRDPELKMFLYQILSAVESYHSRVIVHGDLKPQYVLIDFRKHLLKLADFGLVPTFGDFNSDTITLRYRAPELLLGSRLFSPAADMWSVGCIFGEMVTGKVVFEEITQIGPCAIRWNSEKDQLRAIFRLLGTPSEASWPGVTVLCSSLTSFPKYEPMDLAMKFPDLEPEGLDLLTKMLCLDPMKRISANDALNHKYIEKTVRKPKQEILAKRKAYMERLKQRQGGRTDRRRLKFKFGEESSRVMEGWKPPETGFSKLNVDGACGPKRESPVGCGGIVRDHRGSWRQAFMFHIGVGNSLRTAQLWGCVMGLKFAWEAGERKLILETDSQEIYQVATTADKYKKHEQKLIRVMQALLARQWEVRVKHIEPEGNRAAAMLAKESLETLPGFHPLLTRLPEVVEKRVLQELCLCLA